jgi:hypothetical protein
MPKAIFIMDMPETCGKCKFLYEFQGVKKCQLMNVLNAGAARLSQSTFTKKRHEKCPLQELPEKIPESKSEYEKVTTSVKRIGWNECLDAILEKNKK